MRAEGRAFSCGQKACSECGRVGDLYRCRDCSGGEMLCEVCMVDRHSALPLHVVEVSPIV